jgi:hypothetical protein
MPRRLGDDPLSRKRPSSAKAKDASSARAGPSKQQTSHNDVFFRRRSEGPQSKSEEATDRVLEEGANVGERPEITEVTDIMRTAQVAKSTQGAEQLAGAVPMDEQAPPQTEEEVERVQAHSTVSEPAAPAEPPASITEEPPVPAPTQVNPQPQKSEGFLKRLFGRFGK